MRAWHDTLERRRLSRQSITRGKGYAGRTGAALARGAMSAANVLTPSRSVLTTWRKNVGDLAQFTSW